MGDPSKRGRPRLSGREVDRSEAEDILVHAAALFAKQGFARTTTRQIAAAAGLRQPSLYHYYPTKNDMLHALCAASLETPLRIAERVAATSDPATGLYHVFYGYCLHLCQSPYDLSSLGQSPELRLPAFHEWTAKRDRLRDIIRKLIQAGEKSRVFVATHPEITAQSCLMICESPAEWFRPNTTISAEQLAYELASFCLRAFLRNPADIDRVAPRPRHQSETRSKSASRGTARK